MNIDWGTLIISVPATLVILGTFLKLIVNTYIDSKFKEKLETHKQELQLIAEANKFDFQRRMQDFNLYTTKRHEAYMNIYDKFLHADGHIRGLMGLQNRPDYNEYNSDDLDRRLRNFDLLENKINEFKRKWQECTSQNRSYLIQEIEDYLRMVEIQKAGLSLTEANNYFLTKRLYISDNVMALLTLINSSLRSYVTGLQFLHSHQVPFTEMNELETTIINKMDELRVTIKKELRTGDYESN
ncbi:hypothetical protein [Paenibacillus silviterrae]|uniref:hypothetical protein n=1 Tax=Paenibacillus silviterrae TaxID=3242194 RepID=UPI002543C285|nr:hypothetical protein [Paenibacillus chinjuensis]